MGSKYILPLLVYLAAMNIIAFCAMGIDKRRAKRHKWRVSEFTLCLIAVLGGSAGGTLGMLIFHHKTRHMLFRILFPTLLLLQAAGVCLLLVKLG